MQNSVKYRPFGPQQAINQFNESIHSINSMEDLFFKDSVWGLELGSLNLIIPDQTQISIVNTYVNSIQKRYDIYQSR